MGFGITETAHSCGQLDRVDVEPGRSAVGLWNQDNIQSLLCFAVIKVYPSKFLFILDVLLAINFGVSWKGHRANGELDRAIGSHMVDCLLSAWRVHVKVSACQTGMV